jgi:hypothetical protein
MTGDSSPTYGTSDIDRIDPLPGRATLSSGTEVAIQPLKTRQLFKLLRIVTHGGASMFGQIKFYDGMGDDELVGQLLGLVIFSIPDAEDETIDFVTSMVLPVTYPTGDRKQDDQLLKDLARELYNPELDDLITIIEAVLKAEASDLKALGNRIAAMVKGAVASNQIELVKEPNPDPEPEQMNLSSIDSSEDSPVPST